MKGDLYLGRLAPDWHPDWRDRLKVGQVLREGDQGTPRVIRRIIRRRDGMLHSLYFSILRCSWTRRSYTVVTRSDLATRGFRSLGFAMRIASCKLEKNLQRDIEHERGWPEDLKTHCWDVVDVLS